ncbi:CHASE2 domain-containing protein [Phormidesmis sp. 146-12]
MIWRFGKLGWRLLPGGVTAVGLGILLRLGALQPLESIAYNTLFRARGPIPWDDRLVLVAIDDASIRRLGQFPWTRRHYAQLLDALNEAEPSVVAIDLLFSESTPNDAKFAQSMTQYGRVVLGQAWDSTGLPLIPVPPLRDATLSTGHIHTEEDADGMVRKILPQMQGEPALGVATIEAYSMVQAIVRQTDLDRPMWLNWAGAPIRQYSFADVMQGQIPDRAFRNKIVLVGVTASGIEPRLTPFNTNPTTSGVFIQATIINNLLQQNALRPIEGWWLLLILVMGGPGFSVLISYWRTETQVAIALGLIVSWGALSLSMLKMSYLLPVAFPVGLLASTTLTGAVIERLRMNALLQKQVRHLWQTYESDLVLRPLDTPKRPGVTAIVPSMQRVAQLTALADRFGRSQSTQAAIARSLSVGLVAVDRDGLVWFCNPVAMEWLQLQVGARLEMHLTPEWLTQAEWKAILDKLWQRLPVDEKEVLRGDRWFSLKTEPLTYQSSITESQNQKLEQKSEEQNSKNQKLKDRRSKNQSKDQKLEALQLEALQPEDQSFSGLLLLIEDITQRKQVEANLDQQIHDLNRMSQLKDEFLSTVSHELRTPLTNMKMAIQLLKIATAEPQRSLEGDTKRSHYLKILENECNREAELINDLLDLQRLEAGMQITNPEVIHIQEWLPPIIEPFYKRTEARQQTLSINFSRQLPSVISDQPSLERILVELVNNACKYTPPTGEILVSANWAPPHVELAVSNSGAEIPEHELPRIFERFYRVPQADPWKQGGTGLGLALVKKLVERLGGSIEVKSGEGSTTFTVQLPLRRES